MNQELDMSASYRLDTPEKRIPMSSPFNSADPPLSPLVIPIATSHCYFPFVNLQRNFQDYLRYLT